MAFKNYHFDYDRQIITIIDTSFTEEVSITPVVGGEFMRRYACYKAYKQRNLLTPATIAAIMFRYFDEPIYVSTLDSEARKCKGERLDLPLDITEMQWACTRRILKKQNRLVH